MYTTIKNPATNKWVNVDSKLGKDIIDNYYKFLIGGNPKKNCSSRKKADCKDECVWTSAGSKSGNNRCVSKSKLNVPVSEKPPVKKPADKKPPAKKPPAKKPPAKKPADKKQPAKKPADKKPPAKKPADKKPPAKKPHASLPKIHETYYLTDLLRNYTEVAEEDADYMAIGYRFIKVDGSNTETLDYQKKRYHFGNATLDNSFLPMKYISKIVPEDMANNYGEENRHMGANMDDPAWDESKILANDSANWYKDSRSMNVGDVVLDHTPDEYPATQVPYLVVEHKGEKCLLGFVIGTGGNEEPEEWGFDDGEYVNKNNQAINPITKQLVLLDVSKGIVM